MNAHPIADADRDAQIVALWQGRPREQRRPRDVDAFCQWLVDYAPWLMPAGDDPVEQIRTLIQSHTVEGDDTSRSEGRQHRVSARQRSRK